MPSYCVFILGARLHLTKYQQQFQPIIVSMTMRRTATACLSQQLVSLSLLVVFSNYRRRSSVCLPRGGPPRSQTTTTRQLPVLVAACRATDRVLVLPPGRQAAQTWQYNVQLASVVCNARANSPSHAPRCRWLSAALLIASIDGLMEPLTLLNDVRLKHAEYSNL